MDILFLLRSDFVDKHRDDENKLYYCPDCAFMEGVLAYHPKLRYQLDIRYIDYPHPRQAIVDFIGEGKHGCPHLILDSNNRDYAEGKDFKINNGIYHTQDNQLIAAYLTDKYGIAIAHY